jgi:hypothetical protein
MHRDSSNDALAPTRIRAEAERAPARPRQIGAGVLTVALPS